MDKLDKAKCIVCEQMSRKRDPLKIKKDHTRSQATQTRNFVKSRFQGVS